MKLSISSVRGIFFIFTCFVFVSAQRDFPSESPAWNSTTEFPCDRENGCDTAETPTASPESRTSNVTDAGVRVENDTTLCPQEGCQTPSSSPENTTGTAGSSLSHPVSTPTTQTETNSGRPAEESTRVEGTDRTETEPSDPVSDATESPTATLPLTENDGEVNVTVYPDDDQWDNSSLAHAGSTSTEATETANSSVMATDATSPFSERQNYTETDVTSSETSDYAQWQTTPDGFPVEDGNGTTDDLPLLDTNATRHPVSTTQFPSSTDDGTSDRTTETAVARTTENFEDSVNETEGVAEETSESGNVTALSDLPTAESVTDRATVWAVDDLPTVTPHRNYLTVEIETDCSNEQREISSSLARFLNTTLDHSNRCLVSRNVTLIAPNQKVEFSKISRFLAEKYGNVRLLRMWNKCGDFNLTTTDAVEVADDATQREVVLYVSLGACLGVVVLLAVVVTCFKCLRKRSGKPLDPDVPHLNLRLEDYTLTRIPRPNTVYLDYYRGPVINDGYSSAPLADSAGSERGLIQPFDTSVVPLEDVEKPKETGAPVARDENDCPSTPLRTFGRKDWKNGDGLIYENVMSSSTEKLHPDFFKSGNRGRDNPIFAA